MSKVRTNQISSSEKNIIIGEFFDLITNLKTRNEIIDFFIGLLSPSEILMLSRRIQIAKQIIDGKSYEDIRHNLKVGFSTIYKTDRWLNGDDEKYGEWIKKMISKLKIRAKNNISNKPHTPGLLDKYAHHKLLKNILS